jgi:Domain of unknown function (DUF4166)
MNSVLVGGANTRLRSPRSVTTHSIPNFEQLVGSAGWARLPQAVRARFAADAHADHATEYVGTATVSASWCGRVLAQLCRCIGTPVAPYVGSDVPMRVRVYRAGGGVVWERRYSFANHDCVVRSTKTLDEGLLVEQLGAGLHMRLNVIEEKGALHFISAGYFFRVGNWRVALPDWFLPGGTRVVHEDVGGGRFRFTMRTSHGLLGELFFQDGIFSE